jgi:Fe-S cluster assembly protein SufD
VSTPLFTPDALDALPGPAWLHDRRTALAEEAGAFTLPSTEAEEWRYSRIDRIALDDMSLAVAPVAPAADPATVSLPAEIRQVLSRLGDHSGHIVTVDGVVVAAMGCAEAEAAGVVFGPATDPEQVAIPEGHPDVFATWNPVLTAAPLVLEVPAGAELAAPFLVVHHITAEATATFPHLRVLLGPDSGVALTEVYLSGDVRALSVPLTDVTVGAAARMRHTVVQDLGHRVWQVGSLRATTDRDATYTAGLAVLGGDYARLRVDCHLRGQGSTGNIASAYLGSGNQMTDLRTFQHHEAPDTTSDLFFKGALADHAHSVYTGMIRIGAEARGTNAVQANRVVKLSDHAWAESVPNLEIENNDVRCSHASAVGPVDPDQRFYLESRGVPPRATERLIVGGFYDDALDHFPVPEANSYIADLLDAELDREVGERGRRS